MVGAARCASYDPVGVRTSVAQALARAGDPLATVRRGDRVLVKLNHLGEHPPERAVITHPEVLGAALEQLVDHGARVVVGDVLDRPGSEAFRTSGTWDACARVGVEPVNLREWGYARVNSPGATRVPRPLLSRAVSECDLVMNLPKLKAHVQVTLTLGLKNTYGLLPFRVRTQYHRQFLAVRDFAEMLVDIYSAVAPRFTLMDGIVALEGAGPGRKGVPREVGVLLAGQDPVALDAVATNLVGLTPRRIDTTRIAADRGMGEARLDRVQLVGGTLDELRIPDFRLPRPMLFAATLMDRMPPVVVEPATRLASWSREVPAHTGAGCTSCGGCAARCPEQAITMVEGTPVVALERCQPCFACVEGCPSGALTATWNGPGQLTHRLTRLANRTRRRLKRWLGLRPTRSLRQGGGSCSP